MYFIGLKHDSFYFITKILPINSIPIIIAVSETIYEIYNCNRHYTASLHCLPANKKDKSYAPPEGGR